MPVIEVKTIIEANINLVFDLSRCIDLHKVSTQKTNEQVVAGKTDGLIGLGESVTWRAKHFGVYQRLTSKITEFDKPIYFVDEMVDGAFSSFRHEHFFKALLRDRTEMNDVFNYRSPLSFLGKVADHLFLKNYMTNFLIERNNVLKDFAESDKWKSILPDNYLPINQ